MHRRHALLLVLGTALLGPAAHAAGEGPAARAGEGCKISLGQVRELVRGAAAQRFEVRLSGCNGSYNVVAGDPRLGQAVIERDNDGGAAFTLSGIPADLPLGQLQKLFVRDGNADVVELQLPVGEIVSNGGFVEDRRRPDGSRTLQSPIDTLTRKPIAVVTPSYAADRLRLARAGVDDKTKRKNAASTEIEVARTGERDALEVQVRNHAFLLLPSSVSSLAGSWFVRAESPPSGVDFLQPSDAAASGYVPLATPGDIAYAISVEQSTPVLVRLRLHRNGSVWLDAQVQIAASAHPGLGQPLPISDLLYIGCRAPGGQRMDDFVFNGMMHAIHDGAMAQGRCALYVDPCNLRRITAWTEEGRTRQVQDYFGPMGPQRLLVRVERQDVIGPWERSWPLNPDKWSCTKRTSGPGAADRPYDPVEKIDLQKPLADSGDGEAVYTIEVRGAALVPDVHYVPGTVLPTEGAGTVLQPTAYEFSARLRPPGAFGWPYCYRDCGSNTGRAAWSIRMFVTVPFDGVAFRFPGSVRELRSTTDNPRVQVLSLRTGALLTVEPWDYNQGKNFLAVPLRFQAGMHLFDLGQGSFAPSTLVGISAAMPFIAAASKFTQSTVGIGLFWENDLRDRSNHLLLTIGLNLLSVFSPPAGPSK